MWVASGAPLRRSLRGIRPAAVVGYHGQQTSWWRQDPCGTARHAMGVLAVSQDVHGNMVGIHVITIGCAAALSAAQIAISSRCVRLRHSLL